MWQTLKKPIWRVPLVLGGTGLVCRIIGYILSFLWVRIQIAQGPGPEGSYVLTTGHLSAIMAVISFVLFWLAGWRLIRGLTRREIFLSASIMVLVCAALLAWEQISAGSYSLWTHWFYALAEGTQWVSQLRVFDTVTVSLTIPSLFVPYLYLVFGRRSVSS